MKILHIAASTLAGAGNGAKVLHDALQRKGVDSSFLTIFNEAPDDPSRHAICTTRTNRAARFLLTQADKLPRRLYPLRRPEIFSCGYVGFDICKLPAVSAADIVHLHWVNHGMLNFATLKQLRKPVVWTMRDMWPFTGGCHHAFDCCGYTTGCGKCPHLRSGFKHDISAWGLRRKQKYYRGVELYPVAISSWLSDCARRSLPMKRIETRVINNGIDIQSFHPCDQVSARNTLGLPLDKSIILVGATDITSAYKGFPHFRAAIRHLNNDALHYAFFGQAPEPVLRELNVPYTSFGTVNRQEQLRSIYAAADVFVAPSVAEAFGKTLVEAMACGTPVVCFDHGGPRDIVTHMQTGWRAVPFESTELAAGIEWVLAKRPKAELRKACREHATSNFDIETRIAAQYAELYELILAQRTKQGTRQATGEA